VFGIQSFLIPEGFIATVSSSCGRYPSWLYKQDPTRLIKPSVLTGLIFTQLRLAHGSIQAILALHQGRPVDSSGALPFIQLLPPLHPPSDFLTWCRQQQQRVLCGAVGHGWFHAGGCNSSLGYYHCLPDGRMEPTCSKSLTTPLINFLHEVKDLPEGVQGETGAEIKKS